MSAPSPAGSSEPKTVGACPSCGLAPHPGLLYAQDGVPVQSCLQPASVAEARSIERRALQLRGCSGCGLVFNQAFDPATQRFDIGYEETQAFSPVFRAFADDLVDALVERWEPAGGLVVEIGCGKGDFLEVLCQRGNCRGLGIDPAFEPDRRPAVPGVAFEQRLFSSADIGRPADFLVCRHTLEHIGPVGEFLRQVAEFCRAASVREVFFEVPDARRIAAEGAFWDVYYEHANYFDRGAFAAALEAAGLTVTMTQRLFHSQYLGLFATLEPERPVSRRAAPTDFSPWSALEQVRSSWQRRINEQPGPIVIWGSGSKGVAFLAGADPHGRVEAAVDINPHRQGRFMPGSGQPIIAPEVLADLQPATVVVMNPAYQEEIRAQLAELGLDPRIEILGPR